MLIIQPVYELKEEELVNPPWANGNLSEWLYRPVKVRGRKIHRKEMKFSKPRAGFQGNMLFLPLVTKEDEQYTEESREGLILGLGWIPQLFSDVVDRREGFQETYNYLEFVGVVTRNEELTHNFIKKPNYWDEQEFNIGKILFNRKLFPA